MAEPHCPRCQREIIERAGQRYVRTRRTDPMEDDGDARLQELLGGRASAPPPDRSPTPPTPPADAS